MNNRLKSQNVKKNTMQRMLQANYYFLFQSFLILGVYCSVRDLSILTILFQGVIITHTSALLE